MKSILLAIVIISIGIFSSCTGQAVQTSNKSVDRATETHVDALVTADQAAENALKAGEKMPAFELPDSKKNVIKSADLLKESNLVVVFYRGGWCPFCNTYLKETPGPLVRYQGRRRRTCRYFGGESR